MKDNNRDRLDELIDKALAGYTDAEPLAGLEERVLRRIASVPTPSRLRWFYSRRWALALASILVFLGIATRVRRTSSAPVAETQTSQQRRSEAVAPSQTAKTGQAARSLAPEPPKTRTRQNVSGSLGLPKKDRFPMDSPLTSEERALMTWSTRAPEQMRQVLASLQAQRNEQPVTVEPIRIEPLPSYGNE